MNDSKKLESGTLWIKLTQTTEHALKCGALQPILTQYEIVEDHGIPFIIRILANLEYKENAQKKQKKKPNFNPFSPYEEDLFVSDISETHVCILNKYNVVDHHLLIITREFEEQENWLNLQDFEALCACLAEVNGLGFYNGGKLAGASQPHKHLQIIPISSLLDGFGIPIETAINSAIFTNNVGIIPNFPFIHTLINLNLDWTKLTSEIASKMLHYYNNCLKKINLINQKINKKEQRNAYNLLVTREWMLIVPRSKGSFKSIGVNSVGFAGALLVKNQEQMQFLKEFQPMNLLKNVAKLI